MQNLDKDDRTGKHNTSVRTSVLPKTPKNLLQRAQDKQVGERYKKGLNRIVRTAPRRDEEKEDDLVWSH